MEKFLESAAAYIFAKHQYDLENICLVFPNRRSSVFFTAYLQKLLDKPVIGPEIKTVNEFITGFSDKYRAERLQLISVLFDVFRKHSKTTENFDDFYFWGEVLLSDFDDIDKYLIDAKSLFRNVVDLKQIESQFHFLEEKQKEILRRFWGSLGKWEDFKNQEDFLRLWEILNPVYTSFRQKLNELEFAYEGMIFREVAEKIKKEENIPLKAEYYYIIGLNALNLCEKEVFKYLKKTGRAVFMWDYDVFYADDHKNEAGHFIRENLVSFPPPDDFFIENNGFYSNKEIEIISVASSFGQAQVIPGCINQIGEAFDNTAVVLADESLLFPVLGAIPQSVKSINVTMGYPVKNSTVFGFISLLTSLIKNARFQENRELRFYYRFVFDIINHQLLGGVEPGKVLAFQEEAKKKNSIYILPRQLNFSDLHELIFNIPRNVSEYSSYFKAILKKIYFYLKSKQPDNKVLPELIISVFQAFEKLETVISEVEKSVDQKISQPVYFRLLNQYLNAISVSYVGEPLNGLQVMGILETRCLDFKNVIIIGLNEGHWPRPSVAPSFIPHNLRYAFGLPSVDNQDAMSAYYFYRLIQRAENITITYNSIKEGLNTGELSRFGHQLIFDSPHQIKQKNLEFRFRSNQLKNQEVESSPEIVRQLLNRYSEQRPLSPSALTLYIGCKYRFYLRYLVGLPEGDEIEEEVDSRMFGNIFHKATEILYNQAESRISAEWIDKVLKEKYQVENAIRMAIASEYFKTEDPENIEIAGDLRLSYEFVKAYLIQLLRIDKTFTPFEIVSLEKRFTFNLEIKINNEAKTIPLGGTIDRLDRVGGKHRVIDYKTGDVKSLSFSDVMQLFDGNLKDQKKEAFQTMLYSLIVKEKYFPHEVIVPGIYGLRSFFDKKFSPYFSYNKKDLDFSELVVPFKEDLKNLLEELFSENNVFTQTEITERCRTCPFNILCHR
ncbi:MAG: PD-(D/E)XK nuclease family protein [Prolixibacteraceae bacterium]|nr:PD-(D/E)XK nuclease family protein [Prolixibacteraceae bacterium]